MNFDPAGVRCGAPVNRHHELYNFYWRAAPTDSNYECLVPRSIPCLRIPLRPHSLVFLTELIGNPENRIRRAVYRSTDSESAANLRIIG